jgi:hypothetical protein
MTSCDKIVIPDSELKVLEGERGQTEKFYMPVGCGLMIHSPKVPWLTVIN